MMKRMITIAALVSAFAAQPVLSQSSASAPAGSAAADLLCAAWTANTASKAKTEKEKYGLTLLMTYFIGRWEGATGRTIDEGLTLEFLTANMTTLEGASADCAARSGEFGRRLQLVGQRLQTPGNGK